MAGGKPRRRPPRDLGLRRLLVTDPLDPGCETACATLELYVELTLAGGSPARAFPRLAAHVRACPACRADYVGVLDAIQGSDLGLRGTGP